jgi:hypothetical protein
MSHFLFDPDNQTMAVKSIKCPKCRKTPKGYEEIWSAQRIEFDADSNGVPNATGFLMDGEPDFVKAVCSCGHSWRLRDVTCIDDIRDN